jgi:hypothetical protein
VNGQKCGCSICECQARDGDLYCGEYCQQASSHGVEKDYCQCGHATCATPDCGGIPVASLGLPDSISLMPGCLTVEYYTVEHLSEQLALLSRTLDDNYEGLRARIEARIPRRSPASVETSRELIRTRSA